MATVARIAGVTLPPKKQVQIGLTSIYGIGRKLAVQILEEISIDPYLKVGDLTEDQITRLRERIGRITTEGDLRRKIQLDIKRLQEIGSYRGYRHRKGLPVRGQRTRSNARTKKGKKKTVANKKVATK